MIDLAKWALALMLAKPFPMAQPGFEETLEQREVRYREIVTAAIEAAPNKRDLSKILAVSYHESGWAKDVDLDTCYRGKSGTNSRCDHGKAHCVMQLHVSGSVDRLTCFQKGLALLNRSERACSFLGPDHIFDAYASGVCGLGTNRSRELLALWRKFEKG